MWVCYQIVLRYHERKCCNLIKWLLITVWCLVHVLPGYVWDEVAVFVHKLGPGCQEIAVVEIEQRASTRGGGVLVSSVRILQGSKLILSDDLPYSKTPVPLKEKAANKTRGNNKGDWGSTSNNIAVNNGNRMRDFDHAEQRKNIYWLYKNATTCHNSRKIIYIMRHLFIWELNALLV